MLIVGHTQSTLSMLTASTFCISRLLFELLQIVLALLKLLSEDSKWLPHARIQWSLLHPHLALTSQQHRMQMTTLPWNSPVSLILPRPHLVLLPLQWPLLLSLLCKTLQCALGLILGSLFFHNYTLSLEHLIDSSDSKFDLYSWGFRIHASSSEFFSSTLTSSSYLISLSEYLICMSYRHPKVNKSETNSWLLPQHQTYPFPNIPVQISSFNQLKA